MLILHLLINYILLLYIHNTSLSSFTSFQWYKEFLSKFESRISQLRLAIIIGRIAETLPAPVPFISAILTASRARLGPVAATCLDIDVILATLKLGQTTEAKKALDEIHAIVTQISTTENAVYSKYHRAWFELRKVSVLSKPIIRNNTCYYFLLLSYYSSMCLVILLYISIFI